MPSKMHLIWEYRRLSRIDGLDNEMFFVSKLLKSKRRFLDIGSNVGIYSYYFSKQFQNVEAFEPLSEITYRLKALNRKGIHIHNVALSDKSGLADFYLPIVNGSPVPSLASFEPREHPCEVGQVDVEVLDKYNFTDVDLIKIDVEGHESSVIKGALDTLRNCSPILIVEIEQRHISDDIQEVFALINTQGYQGFFLIDDVLRPLSEFSYGKWQEPYLQNVTDKRYINNFIFLPKS